MKPGGRTEIVVFSVVLSVLIIAADVWVLGDTVKQLRTNRYRATEGVMQGSRTVGHPSAVGPRKGRLRNHHIFVQYTYSVGGKEYVGTELRHNFVYSGDRGDNDQMLMRYPEGSPVRVFYDPRDPSTAVLEVGLIGKDVLLMAFMVPFNALMLGLGSAAVNKIRAGGNPHQVSCFPIVIQHGKIRVRLSRGTPIQWALGISGSAAFLATIAVGVHTRTNPSMRTMGWTSLVILASGGIAWVWRFYLVQSGAHDLVIDPGLATIDLPRTFGRKKRQTIGFQELDSVAVTKMKVRSHFANEETMICDVPVVLLRGQSTSSVPIFIPRNEAEATAFADWLRGILPHRSPLAGTA